jgi:hypothetical protein
MQRSSSGNATPTELRARQSSEQRLNLEEAIPEARFTEWRSGERRGQFMRSGRNMGVRAIRMAGVGEESIPICHGQADGGSAVLKDRGSADCRSNEPISALPSARVAERCTIRRRDWKTSP